MARRQFPFRMMETLHYKTRINAAEARARKALERAAQLQNQLQPQGRLKKAVSARKDDGNVSDGSLEEVSCHGGIRENNPLFPTTQAFE